ncbi:MAG: HEAT repeat domain-containing protein [Candidatus Eremiobacteraeota bacterium]|nr:HEAT repeat domain-containing protein [Candidatus Eremiobacteraeota bacterium]
MIYRTSTFCFLFLMVAFLALALSGPSFHRSWQEPQISDLPSGSPSPGLASMCSPSPPAPPDPGALASKASLILKEKLERGPYRERIASARALYGNDASFEMSGLFMETFHKGNVLDRMMAMEWLLGGGHVDPGQEKLVKIVLQDGAYAVRERALFYLSLTGDSRFLPCFRKALSDDDYYVRSSAARSLGRRGKPEDVPALGERMEYENGWTRLCFAQALAMQGNQRGKKILERISSDQSMGKLSAYALGMRFETGEKGVLPLLVKKLSDRDDRVREIAGRYLAKFAPEEEMAVYVTLFSTGDLQSLRIAASRVQAFSDDSLSAIMKEAFKKASGARKTLLSVFSESPPEAKALVPVIQSDCLEDYFGGLLGLLLSVDRERGAALADSILSLPGTGPVLKLAVLDALAGQGTAGELGLLEPSLSGDDDPLRFHAALAVFSILSRGAASSPLPGE